MHDVRLKRVALTTKSRYSARCKCGACAPFLFAAYVAQYFRINKPLKIPERDSAIVMAEKLLITL